MAFGIAVELFVSLASLQDASCLGHNLVITQVRERICVNICLHAHELASDRMERIGGKVHEQQWLLLVVGYLVADVVAGPCVNAAFAGVSDDIKDIHAIVRHFPSSSRAPRSFSRL